MSVRRERKAIIHKPYVIHIFSAFWLRSDMFDLPPDNYAFVICTRYIYKYEAVLKPFYWMVSEFEDTDDKRNSESFNLRDAKKICDYILTLPSWVTDIYICCDHGQSRSPAVAASVLLATGRSDDPVWSNPHYKPNILVFKLMCQAFGIKMTTPMLILRKLKNRIARSGMSKRSNKHELWEMIF